MPLLVVLLALGLAPVTVGLAPVLPRLFGLGSRDFTPEAPELETALPWRLSVSPTRKLAYMKALEAQLDMIKSLGMRCVSIDERFVHHTSTVKPARIGNLCFESERFRKVRLTYFDAGESVQVRAQHSSSHLLSKMREQTLTSENDFHPSSPPGF
jgi:hypothetical protein